MADCPACGRKLTRDERMEIFDVMQEVEDHESGIRILEGIEDALNKFIQEKQHNREEFNTYNDVMTYVRNSLKDDELGLEDAKRRLYSYNLSDNQINEMYEELDEMKYERDNGL